MCTYPVHVCAHIYTCNIYVHMYVHMYVHISTCTYIDNLMYTDV